MMGYNTVAVLYNDYTHEIEKSVRVGERLAEAMRLYSSRDRFPLSMNFGAGVVISQDHADGEQVVIVSKNTGQRADEAVGLGHQALDDMADCLRRHGYKVSQRPVREPMRMAKAQKCK